MLEHYNHTLGIRNYIINEIFKEKIYCFETNQKEPIVIDCGSNVGYSITFFKSIYPKSIIYGFEPDKSTYECLKQNIASEKFESVTLSNKMVGDINGIVEFYISDDEENPYKVPIMSIYPNNLAHHKLFVDSIDFGEFVNQFHTVDFCKIDIEGAESLVLKSLIKHGTLTKVNEFTIEYHHWVNQEYSLEDMITIFEDKNFKYKIIKTEAKKENWPVSGNTIINFKKI